MKRKHVYYAKRWGIVYVVFTDHWRVSIRCVLLTDTLIPTDTLWYWLLSRQSMFTRIDLVTYSYVIGWVLADWHVAYSYYMIVMFIPLAQFNFTQLKLIRCQIILKVFFFRILNFFTSCQFSWIQLTFLIVIKAFLLLSFIASTPSFVISWLSVSFFHQILENVDKDLSSNNNCHLGSVHRCLNLRQ